jgi:C4-type Zn-finger protein
MTKRRQQGRNGATPKKVCPICNNEYLKNSMEWIKVDGKRKLNIYGKHCTACKYEEFY